MAARRPVKVFEALSAGKKVSAAALLKRKVLLRSETMEGLRNVEGLDAFSLLCSAMVDQLDADEEVLVGVDSGNARYCTVQYGMDEFPVTQPLF